MAHDPWAEYEGLSGADQARLTAAQRRLVAFGAMRADLNNGGFDQYFFNSASDLIVEAIEAARSADAAELAALLQRALDVLDLSDPRDRDARQDRLDEVDADAFAALDDEYQALEQRDNLDDVMSRLGQ